MSQNIPHGSHYVCTPDESLCAETQSAWIAKGIYIKPTKVSKAAATRINKKTCATAWCGKTKGQKAAR